MHLALAAFTIQNAYCAGISALSSHGYAVLPQPQQVELKGGDFEFGNNWLLALGSGVKVGSVAVESLEGRPIKPLRCDAGRR